MSRPSFAFQCDDISLLARSLGQQLAQCDHPPGHVELLNMLARGAGFRNFQHFRTQAASAEPVPAPVALAEEPPIPLEVEAPVDQTRLRRLRTMFDQEGRLARWPGKQGQQQTCLWVIWSRLPAGRVMSEPEVNQWLKEVHTFGDHVLLRRWLCDYDMMTRTRDGREYRRLERQPPPDALALMRMLPAAQS
jgi:hypothetical protein